MPGRAALVIACLGLASPAVCGEQKPLEIDWDGEIRFRAELRTDPDLDGTVEDDRDSILSRLRFGARVTKGKVALRLQIQDSREFGEEQSTTSNEKNLDLHQGILEVAEPFGEGSAVHLGRQEWIYGDERLIGAFGWNNIGRAFDGARVRLTPGGGTLDLLAARLARFLDDGSQDNQSLFGAYYASGALLGEGTILDVYGLGFHDGRSLPGEVAATSGNSLIGAFGGRVKGKWRRADAAAEAVLETGDWRGDDLSAFAFGGSIGWSFGDETVLRPFAGYDYATGDEDPADGERQEFFNFFPTNHIHYGDLDLFGWRNISSPYFGAEVRWQGRKILGRVHRFWLDEAKGPWKDAAGDVLGHDPSGQSGTDVGTEWDLQFWTPLGGDGLKLLAGYGRFHPGEFAEATRGPDATGFGYLQVLWGFGSAGP